MDYSSLPHLNAFLNATSGVLLVAGYRFIRKGRIRAHKACMVSALFTSIIFLSSYLTYHYNHGSTSFTGQGIVRPIYFTILISHTIMAVVIVPFVLVTVYRAFTVNFMKHKRIARWTLPAWLYVSVTGVLVYLLLYQLYPAR